MIGRIAHYTADAVLISTVLAGVKRHTGYTPNADPNAPNPIPFVSGPNASKYFGHYLGVGEYVYDHTVAYAHKSPYFKQTNPALNLAEGAGHVAEKLREEGMKKGGQWFWGSGGGGAEGKGK